MVASYQSALAAFLALPLMAVAALAVRPELPFHPPRTEAERALDAILHRVDADPDPFPNFLNGRGRRGFGPTVDCGALLMPALIAAIAAIAAMVGAEQTLLRRNCGRRDRPDEVCGLDFVPLPCAQDSNETYLYRTQVTRSDEAIVAYRWPGEGRDPAATYRLLRRGAVWRIDGIRCGEGMPAFNQARAGLPGKGTGAAG